MQDKMREFIMLLSAKSMEALQRKQIDLSEWLNTRIQKVMLEDIEFTLSMGRTHFEERISFIVDSVDTLKSLLQSPAYRVLGKNYFTGDYEKNEEASFQTEAEKTAYEYVKGTDIWKQSWMSKKRGKRISIPGYPFEKISYWPEEKKEIKNRNVGYSLTVDVSDKYVNDHIVNGNRILPGVIYFEFAYRAALARDGKTSFFQINNMNWREPIVVNEKTKIDVLLEKDTFHVVTNEIDNRVFAKGTLIMNETKVDINKNKYNVKSEWNTYQHTMEAEEFYQKLWSLGFQTGTTFHAVSKIKYNETEAFAYLNTEHSVAAAYQEFGMKPSILDGALEVIAVVFPKEYNCPYLPFTLEELKVYKEIGNEAYTKITEVKRTYSFCKYDLEIIDKSGCIVADLKGYTTKAIRQEEVCIYESQWITCELEEKAENHLEVIEVSHVWDFERLMKEAGKKSQYNVFYSASDKGQETLIELLELLKNINLYNAEYRLIVHCEEDGLENPWLSGISGVLKTAMLENKQLKAKVIYSSNQSDWSQEFIMQTPEDLEVVYKNGIRKRKVQKTIEASLASEKLGKDGGVYLITGGAGGIGREIVKELQTYRNVSIILTGRSNVEEKLQKELGEGVTYVQSDLSQEDNVKELIYKIDMEYGRIDGVFHCAGVTRDAYILSKTSEEVSTVLEAKLNGIYYLDKYLGDRKLDYMILFSSTTAVFGNIGQVDYAYANGGLSGFVSSRNQRQRRGECHGSTLCVNWAYWKNGGMKLGAENEERLRDLLGMTPIETKDAIHSIEKLLGSKVETATVIAGNRNKIDSVVKKGALLMANYENTAFKQAEKVEMTVESDQKECLVSLLQENIAKVLRMDASKIEPYEKMGKYGLSSLDFIELADVLQEQMKIKIIPSIFFEYETIDELTEYLYQNKDICIPNFQKKVKVELAVVKPAAVQAEMIQKSVVRSTVVKLPEEPDNKIAVIGMVGMFPGADSIDEFWDNMMERKEVIGKMQKERYRNGRQHSPLYGGFMKDIMSFDAEAFGITPREAKLMDPQQRLALEMAFTCFEDAGYRIEDLRESDTGVFVGVANSDYFEYVQDSKKDNDSFTTTGRFHSVLANRISYLFGFHGPSEPIDTACSSSLVAIHHAANAILSGDCEMALAGGVNVILDTNMYTALEHSGMLSPDHHCKTFDESANGYVRSEGCAFVLLKSLKKAIQDKDHIDGVIIGSAVNHCGSTHSITTPSPKMQAECIKEAWKKAKVDINTIGYMEAHGTGTNLGDPIEISGLNRAYDTLSSQVAEKKIIGIGSAKTFIGHTETVAGVCGVIKTLKSMQKEVWCGNTMLNKVNPYLELAKGPFYLVKEEEKWEAKKDGKGNVLPRRAGVSAFGFSGVNAHVALEEYVESHRDWVPEKELVLFSAPTENQLRSFLETMADFLKRNQELPVVKQTRLEDIAYTSRYGRTEYGCRVAMIADSLSQLREQILNLLAKIKTSGVYQSNDSIVQEAVEIISRDRLEEAAIQWTNSRSVNWDEIVTKNVGHRTSYPTIPFQKKKYWIIEPGKEAVPADQPKKKEHIRIQENQIKDEILKILCDITDLKQEAFSNNKNFGEMGIDSIMIKEFAEELDQQFKVTLSPVKLYEAVNLETVTAMVTELLEEQYEEQNSVLESEVAASDEVKNREPELLSMEDGIAIVGMSGTFPQAYDLEEYWHNIIEGKDCITEVPPSRWNGVELAEQLGSLAANRGGFIPEPQMFDAEFFDMSDAEARFLDPQHRVYIENVWKAIENSGHRISEYNGKKVGVFTGIQFNDYKKIIELAKKEHSYAATGNAHTMVSNRISYFYNFKGPSETIDTACSSSLVAVHRACQAIRSGECECAIAGGVTLNLLPDNQVEAIRLGILSVDGSCKTFDKNANGYVRGEGAGVVILKPLAKAINDQDHIYGVIKGDSVNHGGAASSMTAPNPASQAQLIVDAYQLAGFEPESIGYIEAHGTGTELGDPIEIEGLLKAFRVLNNNANETYNYCGLGAGKTMIGHLEAASGIAGLIRLALAMEHKTIPGMLHFQEENPYIQLEKTPFYIAEKQREWKPLVNAYGRTYLRRGSVSSFGFGGSNAHVAMEEYPTPVRSFVRNQKYMIVLSAKTTESLSGYAKDLYRRIQELKQDSCVEQDCLLMDISFTLCVGREQFEKRAAFSVGTIDELLVQLNNIADGVMPYCSEELRQWLQGGTRDFSLYFTEMQARRISLPSYHFMKKCYWVGEYKERKTAGAICVHQEWRKLQHIVINERKRQGKQTVLFFVHNLRDCGTLKKIYETEGYETVMVLDSDQYQVMSQNLIMIRPDVLEDYLHLLEQYPQCNQIIYQLIEPNGVLGRGEENSYNGIRQFILLKAIHISKRAQELYISIVCKDGCMLQEAIDGMFKTYAMENPNVFFKLLDFENSMMTEDEVAKAIYGETTSECEWNQRLKYDMNNRYMNYLKAESAGTLNGIKQTIKDSGVYIITGGIGGVGTIIVKKLMQRENIHLVLLGRSSLIPGKLEKQFGDQNASVKITYIQADITDYTQVQNTIQKILSKYGKINGVIHAAGVIKDSYVYTKSEEEYRQVIAAKIFGLRTLDLVLAKYPLDFFLQFSSISAVLGNEAQSDYAYGNGYSDAYIAYRIELTKVGKRMGNSYSINWPYWENGGLKVEAGYLKKFIEETGIYPLPSAVGVQLLEHTLMQKSGQYIYTYGELAKVETYFAHIANPICKVETQPNQTAVATIDSLQVVQQIFEEALGKEHIDPDTSFEELGVDSIVVNQINMELEKHFGKVSKTLLYEYDSIATLHKYLAPMMKTVSETQRKMIEDESKKPIIVETPAQEKEDIAIIGLSGKYPGADDIEQFWENLKNGCDSVGEVPKQRWDADQYFAAEKEEAVDGKIYCKWGGFLSDVNKFDPLFFRISPKEADTMDPQERIFLQCAWSAVEDAGYTQKRLHERDSADKVGVFVGVTNTSYQLLGQDEWDKGNYRVPTSMPWSVANRISYLLDISGPSMAVDTACSSSLTALVLACDSLHAHKSNMAIVGGVNLYLHPSKYLAMCQMQMLSEKGKCYSFGSESDGFVPGEGVGAVVIKRLKDAERDKDHIYCVIKACDMNHCGHTSGYTVPNPNAQGQMIKDALAKASIKPQTISYIEAHGTGTQLGDPIEITGLTKALAVDGLVEQKCAIGSVKANIGHLEAAAGIAGLTKIILQLQHKQLVPSIHARETNHNIDFDSSIFYVNQGLKDWNVEKVEGQVRRAGLSSFGAGGSNAHVILEEYKKPVKIAIKEKQVLFTLSAITKQSLREYAVKIRKYIEEHVAGYEINNLLSMDNKEVLKTLRNYVASCLKLEAEDILIGESFATLGFDAIGITSLNEWVHSQYMLPESYQISEWMTVEEVYSAVANGNQKEIEVQHIASIGSENLQNKLTDIAYTLQIGRNQMPVRMACVVSSIAELKKELDRVINGSNVSVDLSNRSLEKVDSYVVENALDNKELDTLKDLWLKGNDIDFVKLYTQGLPELISLPTYPFLKEYCWVRGEEKFKNAEPKLVQEPKNQQNFYMYESVWQVEEILSQSNMDTVQGILVFGNEAVQKSAEQGFGKEVISVTYGNQFRVVGPDCFVINRSSREDYQELIGTLKRENIIISHCIIGWDEDTFLKEQGCEAVYHAGMEQAVAPLKYLILSLNGWKYGHDIHIMKLYQVTDSVQDAFHQSTAGIAKSCGLILPDLKCKCVGIDSQAKEMLTSIMKNELTVPFNVHECEVRYLHGERFVRTTKEIQNYKQTASVLRTKGTYLLTGGMGKIGLMTAMYLVKEYQANVVLLGRSQLNASIQEQLEKLRAYGTSILYYSCDITNEFALQAVMDTVTATLGNIHGVLHLAGTAGVHLFTEKEEQEFDEVLKPKILGTMVIDKVFQNRNLDFILLFSSLSSLIGDFGQCDYSMGNRFLDSYARNRKVNKTSMIVINWPLWKNGGMHMEQSAEDFYLKTSGMSFLESEVGMQALCGVLKSNLKQACIVCGDKTRIDAFLGLYSRQETPKTESVAITKPESKQLVRKITKRKKIETSVLQDELKGFVSAVGRIATDRINLSDSLGNYGLDSISLKDLASIISKHFEISLSPSVFFAKNTIGKLAEYLESEYQDALYEQEVEEVEEVTVQEPMQVQKEMVRLDSKNCIQDDIAVIGMGFQLPEANTQAKFWSNLCNGVDCVTEVPKDRWDAEQHYSRTRKDGMYINSKWGAFITDYDKFDAKYFGISPVEAELMDPQQRLFLQCSYAAIEDAGYQTTSLAGSRTGVFVGVEFDDYEQMMKDEHILSTYSGTGCARSMVSNRVSYLLDLKGPSETVDTACSSSLVAIHNAVKALRTGECDMAVAGGVSLMLTQESFIAAGKLGILSSEGKCKTFDASADGYVKGEGVAALFLKPLQAAKRDHDPIYAVVKGSAVNHCGHGNSLTAPNSVAQSEVIQTALNDADFSADSISFIETHGTGTEIGDPIEIDGLIDAFSKLKNKVKTDDRTCYLGSVKTSIGHLEPAAGVVGVIKAILALKHKMLSANLNYVKMNPYIQITNTGFVISGENEPLRNKIDESGKCIPLRAGVSSFGFGGVNAHVALEEYVEETQRYEDGYYLLPLSAKSEDSLFEYGKKMISFIEQEGKQLSLSQISTTLVEGRDEWKYRFCVVASTKEEWVRQLKEWLEGGIIKNPLFYNKGKLETSTDGIKFTGMRSQEVLLQLAESWVSGQLTKWKDVGLKSQVRKVSLPTYPFARNRFWYCDREESSSSDIFYAKVGWEPKAMEVTGDEYLTGRYLVLFNNKTTELVNTLAFSMKDVTLVKLDEKLLEETVRGNMSAILDNLDGFLDLSNLGREKTENLRLSESKLELLRKLVDQYKLSYFKILHLTSGLSIERDTNESLVGAEMAGFIKMLPAEYSRLLAKTMDIDNAGIQEIVMCIRKEMTFADSATTVRYRRGIRYIPSLSQVSLPNDSELKIEPEKVYLITGGIRGIGSEIAKHLVSKGARKLVLCGRQQLPNEAEWENYLVRSDAESSVIEKINFLKKLKSHGAEIIVYTKPLSDGVELRKLEQRMRRELGILVGIIHCAGVTSNTNPAFINKSIAEINQVFEPKKYGLEKIEEVFQGHRPEFTVLFSSVSAVFPSLAVGISDYASANEFSAYFTAYHKNSPMNYRCVIWPSWSGVGMGEVATKNYQDSGLDSITVSEGIQILERVITQDEQHILMPCKFTTGGNVETLGACLGVNVTGKMKSKKKKVDIIRSVPSGRESDHYIHLIKEVLGKQLHLRENEMAEEEDFGDMGVDSILLTDIMEDLEKVAGCKLEPTAFFEYPTIKQLAQYLDENFGIPVSAEVKEEVEQSQEEIQQLQENIGKTVTLEVKSTVMSESGTEDSRKLAIIGIACDFPKAPDKEVFWNNLMNYVDAITEIPADRWDKERLYSKEKVSGKSISKWGGFIDELDEFDPKFFHIKQEDAYYMDPLIRKALEQTEQAIRDAGYEKKELEKRKIAAFIGARAGTYGNEIKEIKKNSITGIGQNFISAHIAHFYDFRGPNMVVDSACSSSIVCLGLAYQSLLAGDCEMAIVGGVDLFMNENPYLILSEGGALSPDGKCHTFDEKANGFVPGEGCGIVIVKRLDKAIRDGDKIYAVVESVAVNNDGHTMGITTPNPEAQEEVIRDALRKANISPETYSYMEAHGTGTLIGDPIELRALTNVFDSYTEEKQYCAVGSVKTSIGHLLTAAGMASLIKMSLAIKNKKKPATLNCETPNPRFNFVESPFYPIIANEDWIKWKGARRAGISSFGFGGTNAHAILNEFDERSHPTYQCIRKSIASYPFKKNHYWIPGVKRNKQMELVEEEDEILEHMLVLKKCND